MKGETGATARRRRQAEQRGGARGPRPAEASVRFPVRIGAIDVGSNAIRFAAVELAPPGSPRTLVADRAAVRLGHGVFLSGALAAAAMDAAVQALVRIAGELRQHGVGVLRAVATSAVREAANGAAFLDRVRAEAGIELETISGSEEARLVHRAVATRVDLRSGRWVLVDLGGGSVEVSLADASGVLWSESHTMGSVRLLEELASVDDEPGRFGRLLAEYVSTLRLPVSVGPGRLAGFVATGGNAESLARLAGPSEGGVARVPRDVLRALVERLSRLSFRQRVTELGLREDRADVILPAVMVFERLAELTGAAEILVPFVGVREGVLLDLAEDLLSPRLHASRQDEEALAGAVALGRRFGFDEAHGVHVAALAVSLFDQLAEVHGLDRRARSLLAAAAVLHDVGSFISYQRHHKHSAYLISESELPGFSPREMLLLATIARYHRKSAPVPQHEPFGRLPGSEQRLVVAGAALLRLADALDREHRQWVRKVNATRHGKEVRLCPEGGGDLLLERWSLQRKAGLFESAFSLRVRLVA